VACALGCVLLARMLGARWSGWTAATLVVAAALVCLIWLLFATPLVGRPGLHADALYAMTPAEFERHVASVFARSGYVVRVVGGSGDGGVDVRVWRNGSRGVVQCKRYRPDRLLGPAVVRELVGTRTHERARYAWLATTAPLSPAARRLAEEEGVRVLDARALGTHSLRLRLWRRV
jgi:hypothetical protein